MHIIEGVLRNYHLHIHVCNRALVTLLAGAHRLAEPSRVVNKRSATISSGQVDELETTMVQVHFSSTERKQQWSLRARAIKLILDGN